MDLLDKLITNAAKIPHKLLSMIVFWFGLVIVLLLAAQITWKLMPVSSQSAVWQPSPISAGTAKRIELAGVRNLLLFGRLDNNSNKPKAEVVEQITDAPKTNLSIQLTGVVASTEEAQGLAVIESSGQQETYGLGDKIKGTSASLKEVYADRIIISNGGRYETLMLDGLQYTTQGAANSQLQQAKVDQQVTRVDRRDNQRFSEDLSNSRDELLADPSKITDFLAISPVRNGDELAGYRLNPGKDVALFKQAGFQANDLAKSINGFDLTDMGQALEVMAQLPELTEMAVMVEREGQLVEIMFSLPE
ncbi:type II secretion system protein GspC [Shewanella sp. TB7-MNA-CIBAN-0143]|jgi:general secretion pathway protein C|uniref:type II secretion system protein GspC n=1 Tax=unclassified Shewanella TaxID=196818 RepID=UPI00331CCC7D